MRKVYSEQVDANRDFFKGFPTDIINFVEKMKQFVRLIENVYSN